MANQIAFEVASTVDVHTKQPLVQLSWTKGTDGVTITKAQALEIGYGIIAACHEVEAQAFLARFLEGPMRVDEPQIAHIMHLFSAYLADRNQENNTGTGTYGERPGNGSGMDDIDFGAHRN